MPWQDSSAVAGPFLIDTVVITVCPAVLLYSYTAEYLIPIAALILLLVMRVTRNCHHLGGQQIVTILGHKVAAPPDRLPFVGDAVPLEVGRDTNVYQRKLHQIEVHL